MQRLFGNLDNAARLGTITADSFVESEQFERLAAIRAGGGQVRVGGLFAGDSDTVYEITIVDDVIEGDPIISTPVFVGVGNGSLSNVAADAAGGADTARTINVVLVDQGTRTLAAYANFGPVQLKAS